MSRKSAEHKDPLAEVQAAFMELNLTTLARRLPELLTQAEGERISFSEFLTRAVEVERQARRVRRVERHLRWSRLGRCEDLEGFEWTARPQLSPQAIRELGTCRFLEERRNLVFLGRSSLGKTRIAKWIGRAACERGYSVYYVTLADMVTALAAARADGTYRKALRRVTGCALLIMDDAGVEGLSLEQAAELFRVVCARYQTRSTILVANAPLKKWGDFLPCAVQAVAITDRLIHNATILRFTGESFRRPKEVLGAKLEDE